MKKILKKFKIYFNISEQSSEKSNILRKITNKYYILGLKIVKIGSNARSC